MRTMAEYIEREAALLMLTYHPLTDPDPLDPIPAVLRTARKAVAKIPAADVVEVVHGEWRTAYMDKENKTTGVECSECGAFYNLSLFDFGLMYNYCPNCGAWMDGDA